MVGIPINIPIPGESAAAQYSWQDIVDGTGNITFYVSKFAMNGNEVHKLTPRRLYSAPGTSDTTSIGSGNLTIDADPFNTPRTLKGNATLYCVGSTASGEYTLAATFYKYTAGGVETAISSTITSASTNSLYYTLISIPLTQTSFAKGDLLRMKITATGTSVTIGANTLGQLGNPLVSDQTFQVDIPQRIDL